MDPSPTMRPAVFTPDNEPYLGLPSIVWFDHIIVWALAGSEKIAEYTHRNIGHLSPIQTAASQIIPQGINIALAIRELLRQGYLFPANVLIRPLIERAGIISYLCMHPDAIELWQGGWKHKDRPSLAKMLHVMGGKSASLHDAKTIVDVHNHIVHGDPISSYANLIELGDGRAGYASSKILDSPETADSVAMEAQCYLLVLASRMGQAFPAVDIPAMSAPPPATVL
jgi:hypothetical protein